MFLHEIKRAEVSWERNVVVEPLVDKYAITADELVWFALHAYGDSEPILEKLEVQLPEFRNRINISYSGYSSYIELEIPLRKGGVSEWLPFSNDSCRYSDLENEINKNTLMKNSGSPVKINFNKVMSCG
ncbi:MULTISPECIES: hypothetical protein [Enterobacteriaceae]|uniref:hypothetical protein n=1 Tax=Enterobacteriaceae TaxID=543 RepID=UPI0011BDAE43|nr:hypothetical protein [Yokenella regensburgei]EHN8909283.1 hypothetical protein [Enterobacter hormaechei]